MIFAFAVLLDAVPSAVVAGVGIIATLAAAWHYASFRWPGCGDEFLNAPDAARRWLWLQIPVSDPACTTAQIRQRDNR